MLIRAESLGLSDVLIPFVIIFAVIFAILSRIKYFEKKVQTVIALVMSLATVIPHVTNRYPPCFDVVEIINNSLPRIVIILIAIVCLFILLGILGADMKFLEGFAGYLSFAFIIVVGYIFLTSSKCSTQVNFNSGWLYFLIPILILGVIIWFMSQGKSEKKTPDTDIY